MSIRSIKSRIAVVFAVLSVSLSLACFALPGKVFAAQSVPYKMNFQGRLNDSAGNAMANGNYNMKFRIYDAATSGTLLWSEQRANSASTGVTVTTGGLFSVQLGDVVSLPPSIFNNANKIYFEIELPTPATVTCTGASCESYTEGAMTPRNPLGSSAYAFNSDTLDGLDSSAFAQLTASNTFTGTTQSIQNASNSANAFNVKDSGGNALLTINTLNTTTLASTGVTFTSNGIMYSGTARPSKLVTLSPEPLSTTNV